MSAAPDVELVADTRCGLGEGPRWHAGEGLLYFVDIAACRLHRLDVETGELRTRTFDDPVACFAFRKAGGFVLGMKDGFAVIDGWDAPLRPFGPQVEAGRPWSRMNDGRCDAHGRFWAGAMDTTKEHHDARVWRLDPDASVQEVTGGALTLNGIAFSPDGRTLHLSDTPTHATQVLDLDPDTGAIGPPRLLHQFPQGHGRPDGGSVDEEGFYWCALYSGARVVRLSPTGEIADEVAIPAKNPCMIAFGGADRRTAYVTTARQGMGEAELAQYPQSGGVFRFRVETPGLPEPDFAG